MADSRDPHVEGRVNRTHYSSKTELSARLFAILDLATEDRGLNLIPQLSRAVRRGDVLELICTGEEDAGPSSTVHHAAYIGFAEVAETGLLLCGDTVTVRREQIGQIAGFDETHLPNHLNVVLRSNRCATGRERALPLDSVVTFSGIGGDEDRDIGFRAGG